MARKKKAAKAVEEKNKSLESWIWDAACSIWGIEAEAKETDKALRKILKQLGVSA
jgi:hypothetical protein